MHFFASLIAVAIASADSGAGMKPFASNSDTIGAAP
jgi:hypothetical protein